MVRRSSTQWFTGDDTLIELMEALTHADDAWTYPERPDLLLALDELLAWTHDSRSYDGQHKPGWISTVQDVSEAASALGANVQQVVQPHLSALRNIVKPDIGADQAARAMLAGEAQALRQTLGQTGTLLAAWKDLTSACSQPTRPMKTVAARRDSFWTVVRATDRNTSELSRSLTGVLSGDPIQTRLACHALGEVDESDLDLAAHRNDPLLSPPDRLDLAAKLLAVTPTVASHVVWLAYKHAHLTSVGLDLGSIRLYDAQWIKSNLAAGEPAKSQLPTELASKENPPVIPDEQDVVLARIDLGKVAFSDAIRVATERLDALLGMSTLGIPTPWERLHGYIHAIDGRVVSHGHFRYEESAIISRHAWDSTAAQIGRMAPRVAPHVPMQDRDMRDIVGALSWWRVGLNHPTAAAIVLNVRVLELIASRLGAASWTNYLEKYFKNIWVRAIMVDVLYYTLYEALHYRPLSTASLARQREIFLEANTYRDGQQGFDVRVAARHLDEVIGLIPTKLPLARDLRSIKRRTANAAALNEWCTDLEGAWVRSVLRLERVRNAITHGGPFTEGAVLLTHPFSQQLSVWALWECLEGFLDGKTLQQSHDELTNQWGQWRLKLRTATSVDDILT